jgi:hypothetical protein
LKFKLFGWTWDVYVHYSGRPFWSIERFYRLFRVRATAVLQKVLDLRFAHGYARYHFGITSADLIRFRRSVNSEPSFLKNGILFVSLVFIIGRYSWEDNRLTGAFLTVINLFRGQTLWNHLFIIIADRVSLGIKLIFYE